MHHNVETTIPVILWARACYVAEERRAVPHY
jgi:hypothetical protein